MKPDSSTSTAAAGTDILPVERARQVAGIYGDSAYSDATIITLVNAAAAYVAKHTSDPVLNTAHIDRYRAWGNRLELRARDAVISMVSVKYFAEDHSLAALDPTSYFQDLTGDHAAILLTDAALASAPALSARILNPIQITYNANPLQGGEAHVVAEAVALIFKALFNSQALGTDAGQIPEAIRRAALTLLRPWRGPVV